MNGQSNPHGAITPAPGNWREPDRRFVISGPARPRDLRDLMGLPFFALGRRPHGEALNYRTRHIDISVTPDASGMATIRDADILLWLGGQIVDALNHGLWVSRHVRFTPWRLFADLGWADGAHQYRRLQGALMRLSGTHVATSLRNGPDWQERAFTWVSDLRISHEHGVALTLPAWFMEGVCDLSRVLSVDPAYFRLDGGLERWLYRLARRHAGRQTSGWTFGLADLHVRSGSLSPRRRFAAGIAMIVRRQSVPGYTLRIISGRKPPVLRITPTVSSTGSVDNRGSHTVASGTHDTVGPVTEIPLVEFKISAQGTGSKHKIASVTYITNIYTLSTCTPRTCMRARLYIMDTYAILRRTATTLQQACDVVRHGAVEKALGRAA
ncbi:replication protein A [Tanticharoenia sakaeratensis NBRC 103193]|uniref:Replication protein A n=1 Tax=Tanticharoenia sakaeratensis NBRC 103193 TaxID=1231623 RepID=A0A0D6MPK2_9PROT|nr:replication protein A [Tanticharoenia sakaeratensis NBRC 103193]GBQ25482.1 plasmid replication initiator RepA [Tanticharoenia sakaeratensis NBRC 103193]